MILFTAILQKISDPAKPQIPMFPSNNIKSSLNASVLHALWSTLVSVASSLRLQRKTEKSVTRKRTQHEIVYFLSERLEQATFMPAERLQQSLLQQTRPCLNFYIFGQLSRCNASLCICCFRHFSLFHFFAHRYVYLENHFPARQGRSTGNATLHQESDTSVWSALLALRD